ncbi:MAG: hypothetical protein K0S32_2819 [Bacteroidetes bacterium]|jgi:hypothetical protein|nr:hypothetical protein [Bacteroidota bacterium]
MKRTIITSAALLITAFILVSATIRRSSSGAPPSHTGAPDEETCATSGCHDDNKINSGTASIDISVGNNIHKLVAGKTYSLKIKITDTDVARFGFQVVAIDANSKSNIGNFNIVDSLRTQLVKNSYKFTERNYVTYTFNGTDAISKGIGEWIVNWTAPADLKTPVTFYVAGVSANDDMSDKGDKVYTKQLTITN